MTRQEIALQLFIADIQKGRLTMDGYQLPDFILSSEWAFRVADIFLSTERIEASKSKAN